MDSPFSDTSRPASLADRPAGPGEADSSALGPEQTAQEGALLVVSFGDAVALDYAAFVGRDPRNHAFVAAGGEFRGRVEAPARFVPIEECSRADPEAFGGLGRADGLILFIGPRPTEADRRALGEILDAARRWRTGFVGIVGSFQVHLDDPEASEAEGYVQGLAGRLPARVAVFRPGHVLSPHSETTGFLRRFSACYPLAPRGVRSCFVEGAELFEAIEAERLAGPEAVAPEERPGGIGRPLGRRNRAYTLLGPNRSWRDLLAEHRSGSVGQSPATALSYLLSWLLVGHLASLALKLASRFIPRARGWDVRTIRPRSIRELLSLCHRRNIDHVKVVGYNNGVVHFGRRYPGKTVVSTVHCRRMAHVGPDRIEADCGVTIRGALDFLASNGQELYVAPNYSYVCLGTAFFVPIHGSAVDYSTVADTIRKVVLYDPDGDRIISATRDDATFRENAYDLRSRLVLLRVCLLVKPKSGYFVHNETLENPTAGAILGILKDRAATNVEIRKAGASSTKVTVSRYYKDPGETSSPALELPRDALGRLWDRLEENPVTSYFMHVVGRHAVWHEELFFNDRDFATFWETHGQLPLRKLQLRTIRRDGLAHSPFRDEDCISIDLFMIRRHKDRFLDYLKHTLPAVRTNPGKHGN